MHRNYSIMIIDIYMCALEPITINQVQILKSTFYQRYINNIQRISANFYQYWEFIIPNQQEYIVLLLLIATITSFWINNSSKSIFYSIYIMRLGSLMNTYIIQIWTHNKLPYLFKCMIKLDLLEIIIIAEYRVYQYEIQYKPHREHTHIMCSSVN